LPADEWNAIALNYTSGTTGNPKGVVTHHRGAYLNAVSNVVTWEMPRHSVYLWTLPMFHCNGWCLPWTLALQAGVSVRLRRIDTALIFRLIREHQVTHLCGAPIVYGMLIDAPEAQRAGITHSINGLIAGSAPPGAITSCRGRRSRPSFRRRTAAGGRGRQARPEVGRGGGGVRGTAPRRDGQRGRDHRTLPRRDDPLQGAQAVIFGPLLTRESAETAA
jgi:acyl-CoA synthetase (AMP-forming)/AMP-acid ligase II